MRRICTVAMLVAVVASPVDAQRHGRSRSSSGHSIPCGHGYISADKVCHIPATYDTTSRDTANAPVGQRASTTTSPVDVPLMQPQSAVAPALAPLREFTDSLPNFLLYRIVLRNAPIDDRWLRDVHMEAVGGDYLELQSSDEKRLRIPLSSIAMYYTDPKQPQTLVVVLRH